MTFTDKLTLNGQNTLSIYKGPNSIDGENLNSIHPDQILLSQNQQYILILLADGLTIWGFSQSHTPPSTPIWGPTPLPPGSQASRAVITDKGEFVVYDTSGTPLWKSDTAGHPGAYVVIEDNAKHGAILVVYDPNDLPLWASDSQVFDVKSWTTLLGTQQVTAQGAGVMGVSRDRYGVFGHSTNSTAIYGETDSTTSGAGVWGESKGNGDGVHGLSNGDGAGVWGESKGNGDGVHGQSDGTGAGIAGSAMGNGDGLRGVAYGSGAGVWGESKGNGDGVYGQSDGTGAAVEGNAKG